MIGLAIGSKDWNELQNWILMMRAVSLMQILCCLASFALCRLSLEHPTSSPSQS